MILLLYLAASAAQGETVKLFETKEGSGFVELAGASSSRTEIVLWVRHVHPKVRPDRVKSVRDQWIVNCPQRTFQMLGVVEHDASGKVVRAQAIPSEQRKPIGIGGNDRLEQIYRVACSGRRSPPERLSVPRQ